MELVTVEKVEVTVLMDSMADYLLPASEHVVRPPLTKEGWIHRTPLLAEHGLSLLIRLHDKQSVHTVLLDTGWSETGLSHNMNHLGINPEDIEAIVLSHGHIDHTGGLLWLLEQISQPVSVVAHPDAFLPVRYLEWEEKVDLIQLDKRSIIEKGGKIVETTEPYLSPDGLWAATGQVPRVSEFEQGVPNAYLERDGRKEADEIRDDQAIVISLKDKGLIVVAGCAHAGIINTITYGKKITGLDHVHAVLGGFHLSGPAFESIHDQTIESLRTLNPDILVPMHCTGFTAIARMKQEFPEQQILSSVGSTFVFSAS